MDIDCRTGDPIAASKDGRVIAAEWGGGYGNMVIVDHGGGFTTLYAHLSRMYASDGSIVDAHEVIGACGATGHATGDHLHFEVRINGHHVNPRPYLP
jgi:murein DD-endopeptidase MepM/ murein hydrolase activator NlpD